MHSNQEHISSLLGFDQVLVPSRFVFDTYINAVRRQAIQLLKAAKPLPSLRLVHPGTTNSMLPVQVSSKRTSAVDIVVFCRFSRGWHTGGLDQALKLFQKIVLFTERSLHLYLIGTANDDHETRSYLDELRNITKDWTDAVTFLVNPAKPSITSLFSRGTIYWHLTGLNGSSHISVDPINPGSSDITLIEAMQYGSVPISANVGLAGEIIVHGHNGYLCSSESEFLLITMDILLASGHDWNKLRSDTMQSVQRFRFSNFSHDFHQLVHRGLLSHEFRQIAVAHDDTLPVPVVATRSKLVAVIIEPGMSANFKACVHNVMQYLGPLWRLQVFYSDDNENYHIVSNLLQRLRGRYVSLQTPVHSKADYDNLLKSKWFWSQFAMDERVLLFNVDSLLLRKGIEPFVEYDFISAPLLYDHLESARPVTREQLALTEEVLDYSTLYDRGAGQGAGLSLRWVGAMQKIIEVFSSEISRDEPEGVFFARNAKALNFNVASSETSYKFAWEVELPEFSGGAIFCHPPIGIHAPWLFMRPDLVGGLINRNLVDTVYVSVSIFPKTKEEIVKFLLEGRLKTQNLSTSMSSRFHRRTKHQNGLNSVSELHLHVKNSSMSPRAKTGKHGPSKQSAHNQRRGADERRNDSTPMALTLAPALPLGPSSDTVLLRPLRHRVSSNSSLRGHADLATGRASAGPGTVTTHTGSAGHIGDTISDTITTSKSANSNKLKAGKYGKSGALEKVVERMVQNSVAFPAAAAEQIDANITGGLSTEQDSQALFSLTKESASPSTAANRAASFSTTQIKAVPSSTTVKGASKKKKRSYFT